MSAAQNRAFVLAMMTAAAVAPAVVARPAVAWADPLAHETIALKNGLRVLLLSDHRTPTVAVVTRFHVGSGDERAGRTGLAHLFEHLMFKGTARIADGVIDRLVEESGGEVNAFTNQDATHYEDVAAAAFLPRALWFEGDRIANVGAALDQAKLDNQRAIIRSERRDRIEDKPYGVAETAIDEELWPGGHPYHEHIMGKIADLDAATVADAKAFFETWYAPGNATMVIAGDLDVAQVRGWVERYLAPIPARPVPKRAPAPQTKPIAQTKERHEVDAVQATRVYVTWRAPRAHAADEPALDVAAAVLAGGKSSRLYRRLVVERRLAQHVFAGMEAMERGGMFQIVATGKPGVSGAALVDAIDDEVAALAVGGPRPEEVERAQNERETRLMTALQDLVTRARLLAEYDALGDADYFDKDLQRYRAVTAADVKRVVRQYLGMDCRVVLTISPPAAPRAP